MHHTSRPRIITKYIITGLRRALQAKFVCRGGASREGAATLTAAIMESLCFARRPEAKVVRRTLAECWDLSVCLFFPLFFCPIAGGGEKWEHQRTLCTYSSATPAHIRSTKQRSSLLECKKMESQSGGLHSRLKLLAIKCVERSRRLNSTRMYFFGGEGPFCCSDLLGDLAAR